MVMIRMKGFCRSRCDTILRRKVKEPSHRITSVENELEFARYTFLLVAIPLMSSMCTERDFLWQGSVHWLLPFPHFSLPLLRCLSRLLLMHPLGTWMMALQTYQVEGK